MWNQYRKERSYQFYVSPALLIPTIEGSWQMSRITSIQQSTLNCCMFYDGSNGCSCCLSKTKRLSMCCDLNGTASKTHTHTHTHTKRNAVIVWKHLFWFWNVSSPYHILIRTCRYTNWEFLPFDRSLSTCRIFHRSNTSEGKIMAFNMPNTCNVYRLFDYTRNMVFRVTSFRFSVAQPESWDAISSLIIVSS